MKRCFLEELKAEGDFLFLIFNRRIDCNKYYTLLSLSLSLSLSTDMQMKAMDVLDYYKTCFQIEFCFRDSKQFTELTDCQSRDLDKLHFHFNAALTSVNIAKTKALEKGTVLSMASVKVLSHNIFIMQRFIAILGIKPNEEINRRLWEEGISFAAIAA